MTACKDILFFYHEDQTEHWNKEEQNEFSSYLFCNWEQYCTPTEYLVIETLNLLFLIRNGAKIIVNSKQVLEHRLYIIAAYIQDTQHELHNNV